jgi:hypothetical protein
MGGEAPRQLGQNPDPSSKQGGGHEKCGGQHAAFGEEAFPAGSDRSRRLPDGGMRGHGHRFDRQRADDLAQALYALREANRRTPLTARRSMTRSPRCRLSARRWAPNGSRAAPARSRPRSCKAVWPHSSHPSARSGPLTGPHTFAHPAATAPPSAAPRTIPGHAAQVQGHPGMGDAAVLAAGDASSRLNLQNAR